MHRALPTSRRSPPSKRLFSSTVLLRRNTVDLAYTRHDPPKGSSSSSSSSTAAGPPIVLMHGLFGSQRNNRTMSKILAKELSRPVYTIDLRNHGDSPHNPVHNYTIMAEDVEDFISSLSLPKPTLIGHSMGAKVAMVLALRRPDSYSGLIPVDNAPVDAALKSDFGVYVKGMKEIEDTVPPPTKQSEADEILKKYEEDVTIRQFLLTNYVKIPPSELPSHPKRDDAEGKPQAKFRWRVPLHTIAKSLPAMADFPFTEPERHQYKGPTLVVRGTRSHYVSDESLPLIGRFFPRFELLDFDAGHWVMSEKFEGFKDGVVEWIGRAVDGKG